MSSKQVEANPVPDPGHNDTPLTEEELALARRGEALIAAAEARVHAPQSLREALERQRTRASRPALAPFWGRRRLGLAAAGTAVAALAAIALTVDGGAPGASPSFAGLSAIARLAPSEAPPVSLGGTPPVLDARVGALEFPDWRRQFGWRALGRRDDNVAGRPLTTVFYRNPDGARLSYSVLAGEPLGADPAASRVRRNGNAYDVAGNGAGNTLVTWTQQGHTCVIVAPAGVPRSRLLDLAASRNAPRRS
jgi:hypothetical protein